MAGNMVAILRVRMPGNLKGADDVQLFARLGVGAGADWTIRHDDGGQIMFQHGGKRADRGFVTSHHCNGARQTGRA